MKLSSLKSDTALIEQGGWVDDIPGLPGIRIKARGTNNVDYRILESKLVRDIPRDQRVKGVAPKDQDRIAGTLLLETVVMDVEGLTEDDELTPIPYNKDLGKKLLLDPDFRDFQAGAAYAGAEIAQRRKNDEAAEEKNSLTS